MVAPVGSARQLDDVGGMRQIGVGHGLTVWLPFMKLKLLLHLLIPAPLSPTHSASVVHGFPVVPSASGAASAPASSAASPPTPTITPLSRW
jgi:hypothetical protein